MARLTDRLSIWLLAGNASGLLLCFNAALDHKICNWLAFRPVAIEFGFGAVAILVAQVLTVFTYSWRGGVEGTRAANRALAGEEAQKAGCALRGFSIILYVVLAIALAGYAAGFYTIIHAPLRLLLDPHVTSMLCPR